MINADKSCDQWKITWRDWEVSLGGLLHWFMLLCYCLRGHVIEMEVNTRIVLSAIGLLCLIGHVHYNCIILVVYACLDTCCNQFLTIIAGVHIHFKHESKLPVC